jgi:hypothetical protein
MSRFKEVRVRRADDGTYQLSASDWSGPGPSAEVALTAVDMDELGPKLEEIFSGKHDPADKKKDKKGPKTVTNVKEYMGKDE